MLVGVRARWTAWRIEPERRHCTQWRSHSSLAWCMVAADSMASGQVHSLSGIRKEAATPGGRLKVQLRLMLPSSLEVADGTLRARHAMCEVRCDQPNRKTLLRRLRRTFIHRHSF